MQQFSPFATLHFIQHFAPTPIPAVKMKRTDSSHTRRLTLDNLPRDWIGHTKRSELAFFGAWKAHEPVVHVLVLCMQRNHSHVLKKKAMEAAENTGFCRRLLW